MACGSCNGGGIAVLVSGSPFRVDHSVVSGSLAGAGIYGERAADVLLSWSDVWGNATGQYEGLPDQAGVRGNVSVDPMFLDATSADATEWDVHLAGGSPLVDAGDVAGDPDGTAADLGAYGGAAGATWDLDGDGWPLWWFAGAWDPAWAELGWDCDDRDAAVFPGAGC